MAGPSWSAAPPAGGGQQPPAWGGQQPHSWGASAPYAWGPGPFAGERPRTNPWAVASLVTGLLALVPVALVAGVVALVQTTRRHQAGRGLAIGGMAAAALWTVVGVAVGAALLTAFDGSLGRVERSGGAGVGTCLRTEPAEGDTAEAVACSARHDGEVYLVDELAPGAWPGEDDVRTHADDTCYDAFEPYVGRSYERSAFDYGFYAPDEDEWSAGERRVVCVVVPFDGPMDGSVRGSGR